jgi:protoporphyrinogen oxidase
MRGTAVMTEQVDGTPIVVLGAGPAGLGAAWQLARRKCFDVSVVERNREVGGNAASFEIHGLRVDYGSHRLHPSCSPEILADIRQMLGSDLLDRPRHGRMRLRDRWVHFPLKPADLALQVPLSFTFGVLQDSLIKLTSKAGPEESFAAVLERGLGRTICNDFYFPYARKIWGVEPDMLDPEQARRRVSTGSLSKMVRKVLSAVPGFKPKGAGRFFYPRCGFGAISEAYGEAASEAGAKLYTETSLTGIELGSREHTVWIRNSGGQSSLPARQILSTIPLSTLVRNIMPAASMDVQQSACALRFRSMLLVYLVLETDQFTEFDAHYFPDPKVKITRLSEPKNYCLADSPGVTVLCAELPCSQSDPVWKASDQELGKLVGEALAAADLPVKARVLGVQTRRLPQAYPIYTRDYRDHFDRLDRWVSSLDGVLTFGRQGLFAHDNTHHTLAMAYALNRCLDDEAKIDRNSWSSHRRDFERHVVED